MPEGAPELDLRRIRKFCDERVPSHLRDQVRIEVEVDGTRVTVVERRPPWRPEFGPEWSRNPVASLRYSPKHGHWSLLWSDSGGRWHRYDGIGPSPHVTDLLAELERDPTGIFWG